MHGLHRAALVLIVSFAILSGGASSASAAVGLSVIPSFGTTLTAGQTNLPASLTIQNNSTPPESTGNVVLSAISVVPSCGQVPSNGICPAQQQDPGVFSLSPTAVGRAGTACAGVTFTVTLTDAVEGRYGFSTQSPIVLAQTGTPNSDRCTIDFTFNVLKVPTRDANINPGIQTSPGASATGFHVLQGTTATFSGTTLVQVNRASPVITGTASGPVVVGGQVSDTASLTGGLNPTGTMTFQLYNNDTCTGTPTTTSTVPVSGGIGISASFPTTASGTYRWVAAYSGDANNNPAGPTACLDPLQDVVVSKASPTIAPNASGSVAVGGQVSSTATISGGFSPSGTVTFRLYSDAACTQQVFTSTNAVSAGSATSGSFPTTSPGTYYWTAAYSGDANNNAAGPTACSHPNADVVVSQFLPMVTTQASVPVTLGGQISDIATISGGQNPGGTLTFRAFGPDDATCSRAPAFTVAKAVGGNGSYSSGPFTPTAAGMYRWTVSYSGDGQNGAAVSPCNAPGENVLVSARPGGGGGGGPINGTPGKDTLVGTPGNDVINCGGGDDTVIAGGGDDVINCGAGNDRIDAGAGNDRVNGEAGNDTLVGGVGNDQLAGGEGDDVIAGGAGNDTADGGGGKDNVVGGDGVDSLKGSGGNDRTSGGAGNDSIAGGSGKDNVSGGAGKDRLGGGSGNDRLSGGSGADRVSGNSGRDSVSGGSGRDRLFGNSGNDTLRGGSGNDVLRGGPGKDRLIGGPGKDNSKQ